MKVFTCFSQALYDAYAHRVVETFENWPEEAKLIIYSEDMKGQNTHHIEWRDLNFPDLVKFKEACQPTEDYRYDAARFSNKVWAMAKGSMDESGLCFWMDADCITYRRPPSEFLNRLIPKSFYMGSFERPSYVETGFWGVRADHPNHKAFMQSLMEVYTSGLIFRLPQWHDCFALDYTRCKFVQAGKIRAIDLTKSLNGRGTHVISTSELGRYVDHAKGKRKAIGYSPECKWHAQLHG